MVEVQLTRGKTATIDDEDAPRICVVRWYAAWDGHNWYATRKSGRNAQAITMHREVLSFPDGPVDHINGDTLNNTKHNLRVVSHQQNCFNSKGNPSRRKSKYKGVAWDATTQRWRATIEKDGHQTHVGYFLDEDEAARMYNLAASWLFGKYARWNIIPPAQKDARERIEGPAFGDARSVASSQAKNDLERVAA